MTEQTNTLTVKFADGNQFFIRKEWADKYPKLKEPVIYRSSRMFNAYIIPVLSGQSLQSKETDEKIELTELIEELSYFGIELNEKQITELSDISGLIQLVNRVRDYIKRKNAKKYFKKKYVKRVEDFQVNWDSYINLLSRKYDNKKLKELSYDLIYSILCSDEYYNVIEINYKFKNMMFEFCHWFELVVIKKNADAFIQLQVNLSVSFGTHLTNIIDNGTSMLKSIIDSYGNTINKEELLHKISTAEKMKSLLGDKYPSV